MQNSNGNELSLDEAANRLRAYAQIEKVINDDSLCAEAMVAEIAEIVNSVSKNDEEA